MTDTQKDELRKGLDWALFVSDDAMNDVLEIMVAKIEEAEMRAEKELYEKIESKLYVRHSECSHYVHIDDGICYLCNPGI